MKNLARSIAIFLITSYIDMTYRYSSMRHCPRHEIPQGIYCTGKKFKNSKLWA